MNQDNKGNRLQIGTKIQFLKTLDCLPTSDAPAVLYAKKGQCGKVIGHDCPEGHWVVTDDCPHSFGAVLGKEFKAI